MIGIDTNIVLRYLLKDDPAPPPRSPSFLISQFHDLTTDGF